MRELGEHFFNAGCTFEDYSVTLIDGVKPGDKKALKKREDFWMYQLRTFKANGGNGMNLKKEEI